MKSRLVHKYLLGLLLVALLQQFFPYWAGLLVALLLVLGFSYRINRFFNALINSLKRLSQRQWDVRMEWQPHDERGMTSRAFNQMAWELSKGWSQLENDKLQLMKIVQAMAEGILVIDDQGRTILTNLAVQRMFGNDGSESWEGLTPIACTRVAEIAEIMNQVQVQGVAKSSEIDFWMGGQNHVVKLHASPFLMTNGRTGVVCVLHEITETRRLENTRREFVANVSHELKTPLTAIRGYTETLLSGALEDPQVASRFVGIIEKNASQLQALVDDLLRIAEIESGRMTLKRERINYSHLIQTLVESQGERTRKAGLSIQVNCSVREVQGDQAALGQVLGNLLDNAIKYTPEKGAIRIDVIEEKGFITTRVTDTGMGIPEESLERVFERFYRTDKARNRDAGGTGLGLSIVKHLVGAMGGEVGVKSDPGKGSCFWFTLPSI